MNIRNNINLIKTEFISIVYLKKVREKKTGHGIELYLWYDARNNKKKDTNSIDGWNE